MAGELYRTYEVLVEESVHPDHPKRQKTAKPEAWGDGSTYLALRDTNAIFQDAVCYYTILLAGLASDLNPLWAELERRETRPGNDVTRVLQRLAANYLKLPRAQSMREFASAVLTQGKSEADRKRTYQLLEGDLAKGNEEIEIEKLTLFAHDNGLRLCSTTSKRKMPGSAWLDRLYWKIHDERDCHSDVAAMVKLIDEFSKSSELPAQDRVKEHYQAAFTVAKCNRAKKLLPLINERLSALQVQIQKTADSNKRFVWLHRSGPVNPLAYLVARFLWLQDDEALGKLALEDLVAFINKPGKKIPKPLGDESEMPSKFPYFTEWLGIKFESPAFKEKFDDAALAMAFEDVFKYKQRTKKRADQVETLHAVKSAFEGDKEDALDAERSPTGKAMTIRGMKGDPRWCGDGKTKKGIAALLSELAEVKELDRYGLRSGTIGGWSDLRKLFVGLEKRAKKENWTEDKLREELEKAVENEQRENRQGFGSADFFNKLCEPPYHHLWSASAERNGIRDFIPHFVEYSGWMEELGELEEPGEKGNVTIKPISYTFPGMPNRHKKTSYRHFDFKAKLKRQMKQSLFRKHVENGTVRYELLNDVALTLSARRLKRDKVMTADGTSINAVWCPPLVLDDDKPRAGKRKGGKWQPGDMAVSFSLMVEDESNGEPQPIHLKVAIPIEWGEQKKLQKQTIRWEKGSLRGYAKKGDPDADKRRHFRWPIDLETQNNYETKDAVTARQLWCGDAEHPTIGFRVKKEDGSGTQVILEFHLLSVDLGTRFSSAFARLRVHCEPEGEGRRVSPDDFASPIRAQVYRKGTLRLQGENAKMWDHKRDSEGNCVKDAADNYVYELQTETYGNDGRGRFPKPEEVEPFKTLAYRIVPEKAFPIFSVDKMTYPELGDHLAMRLRRRISRIRSLFSLRWHVIGTMERDNATGLYDKLRQAEDQAEHYRVVVETLGKLAFPKKPRPEGEEEHPHNKLLRDNLNADENAWKALKADIEPCKEQADETKRCQRLDAATKDWNWNALSEELNRQLNEYFTGKDATSALLVAVIEHCLPLRKRHWRWHACEHRLSMDRGETDPLHMPLIQGMRGLSMRRLEQVLNLRQRCQSFAKLEKRFADGDTGINPPPPMKRGEGDDPCPDLLDKSNELRDQRVNQAAHMILAEALGLELKSPAEVTDKKSRKSEVDLHGEYKRIGDPKTKQPIPRCSVIVLEDLTRYRTSQDRTRGENSRLMQWAHRAVVKKLTDIAKPFGITIMLVDPAFSSRFHSRTGLPGIRVNSESRGFHEKMPYAVWLTQKKKDGKPSDLAEKVATLKQLFDEHPQYNDQLLIAVDGGKEFLPVPGSVAERDADTGLMNADENAAINIGLRALAHPDRWDIFPRLRTTEISEESVRVRNRRGSFAKLPDDDPKKRFKKVGSSAATVGNSSEESKDDDAEQKAESSQYPDFFLNACNFPGLPESESHASHPDAVLSLKAYRRGLFLKRVQQLCEERIEAINERRAKSV